MKMDKLDGLSMNIEQTERDKLRSLFPQCFVEGRLDIDKLLTMCGEYITDDFEKYEFKWKGKSECLQLAQKRSTGTLRPCREESVNFDTTQNLYIEGDNLEVLKLLQTSYYRKVKMIYIDPPYNTGNHFVYEDDFADPMARYKEITSQTTKSNPETMGRFHTNWLNMMYPRLRLAANLLRDDGVIFISIDDNEVHNLRKLCDEVFGEENFVTQISVLNNPKGRSQDKYVATCHEFLLVYSKTTLPKGAVSIGKSDEQTETDYPLVDERGAYRELELRNTHREFGKHNRPNLYYPFYVHKSGSISLVPVVDSVPVFPKWDDGFEGCWTWGQEKAISEAPLLLAKQVKGSWKIYRKAYAVINGEAAKKQVKSMWTERQFHTEKGQSAFNDLFSTKEKYFQSPKAIDLIRECILMSQCAERDIVFDFFSGSATTAHAVMQLNAEDGGNRRFICVQLPELCDEKSEAFKAGYKNICEIGKERIRRAGARIKHEVKISAPFEIMKQSAMYIDEKFETLGQKEADKLDIGFQVFKLDTSNLKIWDNTPIPDGDISELERRLRGMLEIIKTDRSNEDVVYEVMLKLGQDLCEDILELDIGGKTVYGVGTDCTFIVCLAEHITPEDAEAMASLAPGRIIFTDQCFDNATDKSNVKLTLRDRGITIKMM